MLILLVGRKLGPDFVVDRPVANPFDLSPYLIQTSSDTASVFVYLE